MPPAVRELHVLDFYRHVGCDILQFGNYGLPQEEVPVSPARLERPGEGRVPGTRPVRVLHLTQARVNLIP